MRGLVIGLIPSPGLVSIVTGDDHSSAHQVDNSKHGQVNEVDQELKKKSRNTTSIIVSG